VNEGTQSKKKASAPSKTPSKKVSAPTKTLSKAPSKGKKRKQMSDIERRWADAAKIACKKMGLYQLAMLLIRIISCMFLFSIVTAQFFYVAGLLCDP
jgi:hypothetical protein